MLTLTFDFVLFPASIA